MNKKECTTWLFTFNAGKRMEDTFVKISGEYGSARKQMFRLFGQDWAFQYPADKQHELEARGMKEHKFEGVIYYGG